MVFDLCQERSLIDKKVAALRRTGHFPEDLLDFLARTIEAQRSSRQETQLPGPDLQEAPDMGRHLQGVPLMERSRFQFDPAAAGRLLESLLHVSDTSGPNLRQAAAEVRKALAAGEFDAPALLHRFLAGDEAFFEDFGRRTPSAPRLLAFLAQAAAAPSIAAQAEALAARLDPDRVWPHGHCPACGGLPYISHLRDKEGRRFLTCSFCQTDYRAPRIACPYCGEDRPTELPVYEAEGQPGFRIEACQGCRRYLKTMDLRAMDRPSMAGLDDLESLPLDLRAAELGLTRPTLSAYGF